MAKGTTDTGETMVRTGCKRELQFMLKSQSEICGGHSLGRTRGSKSTDSKRLTRSGIKKMRLVTKDEDFVMSDSVEDEAKSDVVDGVDEGKEGSFCESENVVMNEQSRERLEKDTHAVNVTEREIVMACPASFSEFAKLTSRSRSVKLKSGLILGSERPGRRLTRSMSKSEANVDDDDEDQVDPGRGAKCSKDTCVAEGSKSEANVGGEDHLNAERGAKDSCVANGSKPEADGDGVEDGMNPESSEDCCVAEGNKSEANGSCEDLRNAERVAKDICVAEGSKSEANGDEDHRNSEKDAKVSEESCVDAATLVTCGREEEPHEQKKEDPIGLLKTSGLRRCGVKKAVNDALDKPLRRLTRSSLVKQESPDVENNTESSDLGKADDVHANDVDMGDFRNPSVTTPNKRGRPRKFIRSFPAKLKELFDSGILEGMTVYYLRCAKMREAGARGLKGVIKGSGVLCFCGACKGTQVVSPAVYEHHASSSNKRSPEYILLESGFTLRDVMNACKETPLDTLEEKLRGVVGPDLKKSSLCFSCQGC